MAACRSTGGISPSGLVGAFLQWYCMARAGGLEGPPAWLVGLWSEWDSGEDGEGDGSWKQVPTNSRRLAPVPRTSGSSRKQEGVWRGGDSWRRKEEAI